MTYTPFFSAVVTDLFLLPGVVSTVSNRLRLMGRRVKLLEVPLACVIPWCCQPFLLVDSKYVGLIP